MKRSAMKSSRRNTGPDAKTRALVIERAKGMCEFCGNPGDEIQHRKARGMGGTSARAANLPSNLLFLCRFDHHWAETRDVEANGQGLWVSRYADPAAQPLRPMYGPPVWLLPDGTTSPTCPQGETQ